MYLVFHAELPTQLFLGSPSALYMYLLARIERNLTDWLGYSASHSRIHGKALDAAEERELQELPASLRSP